MNWQWTILMLPGLIVGLTFHEFAHAFSASLLGDNFARRQGRVSLNPLRHLTPLGTLAILFLPIGWGKPVQVNLYNFQHPRRDYLLSSLAGPLANLLLAAICLGLTHFTKHTFQYEGWMRYVLIQTHVFLIMAVLINVSLATLNLLPIPPLDGSKIWPCLLPNVKPTFTPRINNFFLIVFLVLIFNNGLQPIMSFTIRNVMNWVPKSDMSRMIETINAGQEALDNKQWKDAEILYTNALAINSKSDLCYFSRANARFQQAKAQEALEDINVAIDLKPHVFMYYYLRADIFIALGRPDDAEKDKELAKKWDKDFNFSLEDVDAK
jgi:Zn-dependent protease